jgi:peptide/nickel transport system substrate-binding protein
MTRRDRAVVTLALVVLVAIAGAMVLLPAPPDTAARAPTSPIPSPAPRVLRDGVVGAIDTLDPLFARSRPELDADALLFSGLTRLGPGGSVLPDLASSWTASRDGRTWTFQLRGGATWHDGVPVTADDVVFTVLTTQRPDYNGPLAGAWQGVTVQEIDRFDVRFTLSAPVANFPLAARSPILPSHLLVGRTIAELASSTFGLEPVGSGPFRLASLDATGAVLQRVPDAAATPAPMPTSPLEWTAPATLQQVDIRLFPDQDALAAAFRAGALDTAGGLSPALTTSLGNLPGTRVVRYPRTVATVVMLNLRFGHTLFQDVHVRRALLLAIDRDALVQDQLGGFGTRADSLVPPASWAFDAKSAGRVRYDLAAAAKELVAAGWKRSGSGWLRPGSKAKVTIELLTVDAATNPTDAAIATRVEAAWARLGLPVRFVTVTADQLVNERLVPGKYDAAIVDLNVGLDADLYPLLASAQAPVGGSNLSGYQSLKLDRLLEAARAYASQSARAARLAAVEADLAQELPILPLAYADYAYVVRDTVQGPSSTLISDPGERFWDVLTWRIATPPGQ